MKAEEGGKKNQQERLDPAMLQFKELWNVAEVAFVLGVGKSTVYRLQETFQLPQVHVGGAIRFRPEAIRAWCKQREVGTADEALDAQALKTEVSSKRKAVIRDFSARERMVE